MKRVTQVDAAQAYWLASAGTLSDLEAARGSSPAARALLDAGKHSLLANTSRAIADLRRAPPSSSDAPYIADFLTMLLFNVGELHEAERVASTTEGGPLQPLLDAWCCVLDARLRRRTRARHRSQSLAADLPESPLAAARVVNRIALAAFYLEDYTAAEEGGLSAARLYEQNGADRLACLAYYLPYSVAVNVRGDPAVARFYAERIATTAEASGDVGMLQFALTCLLITAAEHGDDRRFGRIRARMLADPRVAQFRERFSFRLAGALNAGCADRLDLFARGLQHAYDAASTAAERSLAASLMALSHLAAWEDERAAERLAEALRLIANLSAPDGAYDVRWVRISRIMCGAVELKLGQAYDGRRRLRARAMHATAEETLAHFVLGLRRLDAVDASVRGYARVVDAIGRARGEAVQHTLTRRQVRVLREYARLRSSAAVAESLGISVETVNTHLQRIRRALGVRRTHDAVGAAQERSLIPK